MVFCYNYSVLKGKAIPVQTCTSPQFQKVEAPIFHEYRHMMVVKLLNLGTGRLFSPPPPPKEIFLELNYFSG
jgi:hypothetical protein